MLLALQHDAIGEAFTISDGVATPCATFYQTHARIAGKPPVATLPAWLLVPMIALLALACRLIGRKPPATAQAIRFLQRRGHYSIDKARRVLGYQPRISLAQGMAAIERQLGA